MTKEQFKNFFREGTPESMARLLSFGAGVAAFILSLGGVGVAICASLTTEYVFLTATVWAAAMGGKNWAKKVELSKKDETK